MNYLIRLDQIKKNYHTKKGEIIAINNVSFEVNKGEIIAIVGSSGCGKSSLLSIIAGITPPSSGDIIKHDNINCGYMLQNDCLFPWLTVKENALIGLKIKQKTINNDILDNLLNKYDLFSFKDKYPASLSGGMKQRLALIRTMLIEPDIYLLDEPFSALDYQTRLTISDDVHQEIKNNHKSAIIVTHDIAEAITFADRVIILTKRPAEIKKEIMINKDTIYPSEFRNSPLFKQYYDMIWEEIDHVI